jgi:hypothetical protein
MRTTYGKVVSSQLEQNRTSDEIHGAVTILTPRQEYMEFDVDAYTKFDALQKDSMVKVRYEYKTGTNALFAKRIVEIS